MGIIFTVLVFIAFGFFARDWWKIKNELKLERTVSADRQVSIDILQYKADLLLQLQKGEKSKDAIIAAARQEVASQRGKKPARFVEEFSLFVEETAKSTFFS